ncbi:phosphonoacetaldehyde hydrolase [Paenibacillus chitinolyticus]|uniref:phosphonoacetaldehyde hydrolase n=1 Tax=Paenibacillus chitinolyticus TaxID=79263 RepID=UPI00365F80F6
MIKAVIMDWAGTTVDYGCFAPLNVFIEIFRRKGIEITQEEAREPMGLLKWDHIREITKMPRVAGLWEQKFGSRPNDRDVDALYADFEPLLFASLRNHCEPVPGILELVGRLRERGIKIGSTTGYTEEMMDIVVEEAGRRGYRPDVLVTPTEMPAGRPYPWMIYENCIRLGVYPLHHVVKVGDTLSDIREGLNAGVWTVGVVLGSSELGMSEAEVSACPPEELKRRCEEVRGRFYEAGAHYVIESVGKLDTVLELIEASLKAGAGVPAGAAASASVPQGARHA